MDLPCLVLPLSILLLFSSAVSSADIPLGASITASDLNETWNSPNSTFSLGFIAATPTSFYAAITYGGVPIWRAGGAYPVAVDFGGSFRFLTSGNLHLVSSNGTVLWESGTAGRGVSSATLSDSGNLDLRNGTVSVWSTFENPTDTIVPTQNFTTSNSLRSGLYSFSLTKSGNLTLTWNSSILYWSKGLNSTVDKNLTSPSLGLQSIGILSLSDLTLSTSVVLAYSSDYAEGSDLLRFVRLDSDGNLRIYSSDSGSGISNVRWAAVEDQCEVFGYCGNLGICSYNDSTPVCGCPSENFELVDPKDSTKGCKRKEEIENCPGDLTMLELQHAKFLTYSSELSSQVFFVGISACRLNCLVGGSCIASTSLSDGTGLCYLKVPGFVSGYQSPALPSTSYVKVCGPVVPNPSAFSHGDDGAWKLHAWIVAVVVLGTLAALVLLEGGLWWWCCKNSPKFGGLSAQYALLEYASGAPVQFSYKELQRSTKGFKEKLGAGGFGAVYRGILANRTIVAVKQLEGIEQGENSSGWRLLVYEFMKNGSLDTCLFPTEGHSGRLLNWENRFSIALGTARGITYLHEECRDCIVHCDIKPENILLDENYNAKVSDFGLAKLINPKDHRYRTLTSVRGTRGYLAPEWLANLPITSKSDVYSYGMVLLEIVSGKRNFEVSAETNRKKFSLWAYEEFEKGNMEGIVDKRLGDQGVDMEQAKRAIQVSFWCIQEQPSQRPMMGKVVQMLEGVTEIERPPAPKAAMEVSAGGTSINVSSNVSALSTFAASAPAPSSSSSMQNAGFSSFVLGRNVEKSSSSVTGRNVERASSSLLHSEVAPGL
ncbi:G-type lectin S-receptor-like serine/threonine-protein kinase [Vitis vinifera]|uniref:Receptor-like serine/threonine-protein kinase n=1 Tax=Vitis vinifera TaxID=29760 RepID=A0A438HQE6_VITVI|nr:G-type lectin S-receptor-like serine/threonine-protein kinase [Vitis vinifera]